MGLVYTKMKIFHFREKLDSLPLEKKEILPPVHIRIKPTNVCNHRCLYCSYLIDNVQLGQDMSQRDFIPKEKMLEILNNLNDMQVKALTFSGGGEPFCYPYLLEAVKFLVKTKIKFATLTNGSKVGGELAEIFSEYGTWLRVSIDGWDDESYSYYRRVPSGEFTKIMKNMKDFKKLGGKCFLGVNLVVDNKNAVHIYELVKQIKDIGANSVKVSPCIISNDRVENNLYHQQIFTQVKEQISLVLEKLSGDGFEVFDSYHVQLETFEKKYTWCPYLQILPVIGADLNVYSCHDKAYNLDEGLLGSIKEQSFKQFWFSDKRKFFKIDPVINCNHHCVANEHNKMILNYLNADRRHLEFV